MSLSSKEAAETLSDVERASRRSAQLYGYSRSAPHLIMWGSIWVVGYTQTDLFPRYANWGWIALILAGVIGGAIIGQRNAALKHGPLAWRMFAVSAIAIFFVFATYTIMWPVRGEAIAAYPALITGTLYAGIGLWAGLRYVITGIVVVAATLGGYFFLHEHLLLWMAFVGGGGMILAGIWFRKV
ncbi:MAG TPA: hypothetical protein VGC27_05610 [Rhizomicrobium sp.]